MEQPTCRAARMSILTWDLRSYVHKVKKRCDCLDYLWGPTALVTIPVPRLSGTRYSPHTYVYINHFR